jgi:hypothetical protein
MTEYIRGNVIICVSRPDLTDEERKKREEKILSSLQQYGKEIA